MNQSKKQLGFAPLIAILIAVVLIVAGGAGYYFYITSQEQKEQVVDETADWKVYKDGGYGYEFKYPDGFDIEIESTEISDLPEKAETGLSLTEALNEQDLIDNSDIDDDCSVMGTSLRNPSKLKGIKSYCKIKQFNQIKGKLQKFYRDEDLSSGAKPSFWMNFIFYQKETRISLSVFRDLPELYPLDRNTRIAKFNEYFDSITMRDPANPDLIFYDTFEKVLSALKFIEIEEDKIADWQTYQNENYGFSFAYPKNFFLLEDSYYGDPYLYRKYPIPLRLELVQDIYKHSAQIPVINFEIVETSKTIEQVLNHIREVINEQAKIQVETPESPFYGLAPPEIKFVETVTVGDSEMTKVMRYLGPDVINAFLLQYYIMRPGYVFVFSVNYKARCGSWVGVGDCGVTEKRILPRILSTLKFTK